MKGIIKRIIAIILVLAMVLMCGGCSVSVSEEAYELYLEDPHAYMDEQLGEDNAWGDFWAGPIGRLCMAALVGIARRMEANENESLQGQTTDEDVVNMLSYDTHGYGEELFQDYDWEYLSRDQNWYIKGTGYISHWLAGAKGHYKDAFRAYIKEFIVENECRYATEISFEEEKASLLSFLESIKEIISDELEIASATGTVVDAIEYEGLIETIKKAKNFDEKIDADFKDLMERTIKFAKERDIKTLVKVEPPKSLKGVFQKVGKGADKVVLAFDIASCIKTRSDVLKTQRVASEFFELTEIFETIVENTTNTYMRKAAKEILTEIKGGSFKDLDDLIEREAVHTVLDINPYVSVVGGLIDTIMVTVTPIKDLDTSYLADAIRHIKMACCELLEENTEYSEGNLCFYKEENKEKIDVYLRHCLYSELVWTYTIHEGKIESGFVLDYVKKSGIELPEVANNYTITKHGGGGHPF